MIETTTNTTPSRQLLVEPPIFIFGSGRSGTTLLQSILSAHSRIAIAPETHFCRLSERFSGVALDCKPPDFEGYWRKYAATTRFADLNVLEGRCRELILEQGELTFCTTLSAMLEAFRERTGKSRVGEKTPRHMHYTDQLFDWFPDARMIAVQRDPRAVIASELQTPWLRPFFEVDAPFVGRVTRLHRVARSAISWNRINGTLLPNLAYDPRVKRVRYEELVRNPEKVVRDICTFLDETFEPGMLDDRMENAYPVQRGSVEWDVWMRTHNAVAHGAVSGGGLTKWRSNLTHREIAVIEAIASKTMGRLGYSDLLTSVRARRISLFYSRIADMVYTVEKRARDTARWLRGRPE